MSKTIAIFGAGSGLGTSVAFRFGREGYRVALIARRREALETLASQLAAEGIEVKNFLSDLSVPDRMSGLVAEITKAMGPIDVLEYAPSVTSGFIPAAELDAQTLQNMLNLFLLTPVTLVNLVLPGMIARGNGGILVGQGASAIEAPPFMSGFGPVMAATRNYLYTLNGEVGDKGVYVGTVTVNGMIERSAMHRALSSGQLPIKPPEGTEIPMVNPDELAEMFWDMYTKRDRVESICPPFKSGWDRSPQANGKPIRPADPSPNPSPDL